MRNAWSGGVTMSKLKELVHYICAICLNDYEKPGATKLNKILWYVDALAFLKFGKSVSGATAYVKRQYGPVPKRIQTVLEDLETERSIAVEEIERKDYIKRNYTVLKPANEAAFTDEEKELINGITRIVCERHTAKSISNLSHDDVWKAAKDGEDIPLYAVLARPDELTNEDEEWFNNVVESRHFTSP
jgi:hypothetical protein